MGRWAIGIDLGGTYIKFGLLSAAYRPEGLFQLPTPQDGAAAVVAQMVAGAKRLMADHGLTSDDVVGVGIGAPGPMDMRAGIIHAMPNIAGMNNCPLRDLVSQGLGGMPSCLENDANAAGYGEFIAGAGREARDMILLTLGTGLGGGVVLDGKVFHGAHQVGAELGHVIVQPGGEECGCGQRGCLERYSSATFLALRARRMIEQGRQSVLSELLSSKGDIDAQDVNEARKAGDALAAEVWDAACYYLALGCVSFCRIFDPDRIVFAGGLTKAGDDLMDPVREHFRRENWRLAEVQTELAIATLGHDAGIIGAAGVAWSACSVPRA